LAHYLPRRIYVACLWTDVGNWRKRFEHSQMLRGFCEAVSHLGNVGRIIFASSPASSSASGGQRETKQTGPGSQFCLFVGMIRDHDHQALAPRSPGCHFPAIEKLAGSFGDPKPPVGLCSLFWSVRSIRGRMHPKCDNLGRARRNVQQDSPLTRGPAGTRGPGGGRRPQDSRGSAAAPALGGRALMQKLLLCFVPVDRHAYSGCA